VVQKCRFLDAFSPRKRGCRRLGMTMVKSLVVFREFVAFPAELRSARTGEGARPYTFEKTHGTAEAGGVSRPIAKRRAGVFGHHSGIKVPDASLRSCLGD
jgi:hypothetical protein